MRGQILTNLILATLYATGLTIVGVRLGALIGILTGLLAFVPYVGLAIGMVPGVTDDAARLPVGGRSSSACSR